VTQPSAPAQPAPVSPSVVCRRVVSLERQGSAINCLLTGGDPLTLPHQLGGLILPFDELEFDVNATAPVRELLATRTNGRHPKQVYFASIGYVTQPKTDKRDEYFLLAEVRDGRLGVRRVHLPSSAVRDYFYFANRQRPGCEIQTLYDLLRTVPCAALGDLRVAFRVRTLELEAAGAPREQTHAVERAFNQLAHPELRSCYDALLADPHSPALFPYGGCGSLLVTGELSPDRETLFARTILSFVPDRRKRRFRAPLRKIEFLDGCAMYRDSGLRVEIILDPASLPISWDPTWNQWRHLVGAKVDVEGEFVKSGKYRFRSGEWHLADWEAALPSRLTIALPASLPEQLASARQMYRRFGQFFDAFDRIRQRLDREALEWKELARTCDELGVPPDFDIAQISWKPGYDFFHYQQLRRRARRTFLFRDEYIFELERATVVEVPQQGHATYVFSRPADLDQWVREYSRAAKEDLRHNRGNIAERLGFIGRVMHGRNPWAWLRQLRAKIGEPTDATAMPLVQ
jgi:hypothetical protein